MKISYAESVASGAANADTAAQAAVVAQNSDYLRNQAEHHRQYSFQDEFRRMLERYQVASDERYVWEPLSGLLMLNGPELPG